MAQSRSDTDVYVVEPLLPQRLRRPSDLLRFFATLIVLAAVVLLALVAKQTLIGLEADVKEGAELVPPLGRIAAFLGGAAVLIVPAAFAVERVFHRDGLRVAEGLIAAIIGMAGSFLLGQWLISGTLDDLRVLLTGDRTIEPLNTLLTSVVAYATAVRISRRPTWRMLMWTTIALYILAFFSGRQITIPSAIVTVLVGMAIGYATLYGVGSPN
ncbi:TIGR00374 family protein, partial [Nonomuraea terrae]